MRGAVDRIKGQAMADRVLAFNTAMLTRAKKLPRPQDFVGGEKPKATGDAALASLRAYAARLPRRSWSEWQKH
jgi:hypothetical protein